MKNNDDPADELRRLNHVVRRNKAQFIESEFSLAFTFCDLAETEYKVGDREHGDKLVKRAAEAANKASEYLGSSDLPPQQIEAMREQLKHLRGRLKKLQEKAA